MADFPDNVFNGSIDDLNNVVNSTIAGIPLKQNEITKEELQKAISTYPVLFGSALPTPATQKVENRQMVAVKKVGSDNEFDLYICLGTLGDVYRWGHIGGGTSSGTDILVEDIQKAVNSYLDENPVDCNINPVSKTEDMTQPVGVDENGQLWVVPIGGGLTTAQINALDGMFKVCAYIKEDVSTEYEAFKVAFGLTETPDEPTEPDVPVDPDVTLTSISATYTGGNVEVGTALTALTGITVTATYSDGSTANVTGYTLSGTIAEGDNTITVSYGGKTTTFTVTGVAESGGETTGVSNETTWTDGVAYTFDWIDNEYVKHDTGTFTSYNGWRRTPHLYCEGASRIDFTGTTSQMSHYSAFYDADKLFVSAFEPNKTGYIDIPEGVAYFAVSGPSSISITATPRA